MRQRIVKAPTSDEAGVEAKTAFPRSTPTKRQFQEIITSVDDLATAMRATRRELVERIAPLALHLGAARVCLRELAARAAADGHADLHTLARLGLAHLARAEQPDTSCVVLPFPGRSRDG